MCYGLATMATLFKVADTLLRKLEFEMLSVLGVNRNIKQERRTTPRTFGGIDLFSISFEQTICAINMVVQH